MTISFEDKEKIEELCKLDEFKLFALETEENYLCLPFDDEKSFKVIKTINYYDSYFDISDDESKDIINILLEFKEKGTKKFKEKIGNYPPIDITFDAIGIGANGIFMPRQNSQIKIGPFDKDFIRGYGLLVHEFIHYKDYLSQHEKFTNWDFRNNIVVPLKKYVDQNKNENIILTYEELGDILNIQDRSSIRYIASLLQKIGHIEYIDTNFTKVLIKKDTFSQYKYESSEVELNTFFSNHINFYLNYITKAIKSNQNLDSLIIHSLSVAKLENPENERVPFTDNIYKKVKAYLNKNKEVPNKDVKAFVDLLESDKNITDFNIVKNQNKNSKQLKNYTKIVNSKIIKDLNFNDKELIDFLNSIKGKKSTDVSFVINTMFNAFDAWYEEPYQFMIKLGNEKFNKEKYFDYYIEKAVHTTVRNMNFNNPEEEKEKAKQLYQNYKKKLSEKLKDYEQNLETNKEAYDKLKESLLRNYIKQLLI